jgi:hypothetical protein
LVTLLAAAQQHWQRWRQAVPLLLVLWATRGRLAWLACLVPPLHLLLQRRRLAAAARAALLLQARLLRRQQACCSPQPQAALVLQQPQQHPAQTVQHSPLQLPGPVHGCATAAATPTALHQRRQQQQGPVVLLLQQAARALCGAGQGLVAIGPAATAGCRARLMQQ